MVSDSASYYAPCDTLPCRLPTTAEIQSSEEIMCDQSGRKVVGIGKEFVVKYGMQVNLEEGRIMLHISKTTLAPVPKVYALFRDAEQQNNYIVMERIQGKTLEEAWPALTTGQKEDIAAKLKLAFNGLRDIPSRGVFCGFNNGPLPDDLFWNCQIGHNSAQQGPFDSEDDLNRALLKRYTSQNPRGKVSLYERVLPIVFSGHLPVLTHGDLQPKNVMVTVAEADPLAGATDGDLSVIIIDWESAGWYPSYWEYARALFACGRFEDDWNYWLDHILEPYWNEYAWMNNLMLELWS